MLEIKDLVVKYGQAITAVDSVSIDVPEGRLVAIVGANGAGKTSLLSAVAGLGARRSRLTNIGASNGLLRDYFPKHTDLRGHTVQRLAAVAAEINTRPRKTLDWATPADLFRRHGTPATHAAG